MKKPFIFFLFLFFFSSASLYAQKKIVQAAGIVVGGDSLYGLPNIAVFVEQSGRGVYTNEVGYFSLPVLAGDTLTVTGMGYIKTKVAISDTAESITLVIRLGLDTFMLPGITLWPYPTFESLKKAFLAMDVKKSKHLDYAQKNLNSEILQQMVYNSGASANMNQRYFTTQQLQGNLHLRANLATTLLNPFAWARFIKSAKNGDLRNKKWEDIDRQKEADE